jgi:hypothetical protein
VSRPGRPGGMKRALTSGCDSLTSASMPAPSRKGTGSRRSRRRRRSRERRRWRRNVPTNPSAVASARPRQTTSAPIRRTSSRRRPGTPAPARRVMVEGERAGHDPQPHRDMDEPEEGEQPDEAGDHVVQHAQRVELGLIRAGDPSAWSRRRSPRTCPGPRCGATSPPRPRGASSSASSGRPSPSG